jgi:hypothetical protein
MSLLDRIHGAVAARRQAAAQQKLAAMIAARRNSPECCSYRAHRAAALKGTQG